MMASIPNAIRKALMVISIFSSFTLFHSEAQAQSYVDGQRAIQILQEQIHGLQAQSQQVDPFNQQELLFDIAYRIKYAQDVMESIQQQGLAVSYAIDTKLPTEEFEAVDHNTGDVTQSAKTLDELRFALKSWIVPLLQK